MNDKKLRKISKKELLEILLDQAKKIEELEKELEKTQKKLNSKRILVEESGTLAEASLKLNNIFEIAQQSADQYLFNVKEKCKKMENDTKKACQLEKENMLKEVELLCEQKKKEAEELKKKPSRNSQRNKRTIEGKRISKTSKKLSTDKIVID